MAKQLNVDLRFNADVSQAKQQINSLQKSLDDIMRLKAGTNSNLVGVMTQDIEKASNAAAVLKVHLKDAFNVRTGKIDFIKLNQSLKQSGLSAQQLKATFQSIGPAGQQAFMQFSQAVATSEISIVRISDRMRQLGTVMTNTIRWQISSTVLHGLMRSISTAYNYAKDLNESLNRIRIVTGQSVEQMDAFADRANKAAKALSVSTTAYTDAALIFYQQGLNDQEVEARTNVTMKMANITGQSATEVSSQMTAIWNNFAEGSENLEYFADVITALGAKTASSSEEISQGLQKFAAVADTVGLSYEKATAALATVVAETRQSADTVGTSFKTIFARLESVSLGETLEDGVGLSKYSEALAKVGVNILDQQGHLKQMDNILDELGAKWNTLNQEQKVALANTVGGVRQYAQFMALMNNYDKVLANQQIAESSEGTVQKQQEIYAESWEAASKRAKAALEGFYTTLLNDDAFISITNGFANLINFVKEFSDSLGGLKGILIIISSLLMKTFSAELGNHLNLIGNSFMAMTARGRQKLEADRTSYGAETASIYRNGSAGGEMQAIGAETLFQNQRTLEDFNQKATPQQQKMADYIKQRVNLSAQAAMEEGHNLEILDEELERLERLNQLTKSRVTSREATVATQGLIANGLLGEGERVDQETGEAAKEQVAIQRRQLGALQYFNNSINTTDELNENMERTIQTVRAFDAAIERTGGAVKNLGENGAAAFERIKQATERAKRAQEDYSQKTKGMTNEQKEKIEEKASKGGTNTAYKKRLENPNASQEEKDEAAAILARRELKNATKELKDATQEVSQAEEELNTNIQHNTEMAVASGRAQREALDNVRRAGQAAGKQFGNAALAEEEARQKAEQLKAALDSVKATSATVGQSIATIGGAMMQFTMALNAIKSIGSIWSNDDISTGEKLLQTMMSLSMILPIVTTLLNKEKIMQLSGAAARLMGIKSITGETAAEAGSIPIKIGSGEAGYFALGPLLIFVGIAAGAILLIVGITAALKALANAESDEAKALREANEQLEEQKKLVEDTKKNYEEVKSALEEYNKSLETLYQCTQGTKEWYEATKDLNEEIQTLLEKYPDLTKYENLFNSDGTLNQQILEEFEKQSQQASIVSSIGEIQDRNNIAIKNATYESANMGESFSKLINSIWTGQTLGFNTDTGYVGDISDRALTDAFVKALKENGAFASKEDISQFLKDTALGIAEERGEGSKFEIDEAYQNFSDTIDYYADALFEAQQSVNDLSATMAEAAQSITNSNKLIQQSFPEGTFSEDLFENFNQMIAFTDYQKKLIDEQYNSYEGIKGNGKVDKEAKTLNDDAALYRLVSQFLNQTGRSNQGWEIAGVKDGKITFKVEGQEELEKISANTIFSTMALNEAYGHIDSILRNAEDYFTDIQGTNADNVLLKFFSQGGTFSGITIGELEEVFGGEKNLNTWEDIAKKFGMTQEELFEKLASQMGIEVDEFTENFGKLFKDRISGQQGFTLENELKKLDIVTPIKENLQKIGKNINIEDLQPFADTYTKVLAQSGKEGLNFLQSLIENIPKEQQSSMARALSQIDFNNLDITQIQNAFKSFGVTTEISAEQAARLKNLMSSTFSATVEQAQETYNAVSKIVSKLKAEGDTIEKESYEQLIALNPALESYFTMMADGTYMLTGAAEDFKSAVQLTQKAALEESLRNADKTIVAYSEAQKKNLSAIGKKDSYTGQLTYGSDLDEYRAGYSQGTAWNKYGQNTELKLDILKDSNFNSEDITKWQAAINAGENLAQVIREVDSAYENLNLSDDQISDKLKQSQEEAYKLKEALKFQDYQNEITNVGLDFKETEDYAQYLAETQKELNGNIDAARELAIANQRLDRGLSNLNDDFKDISKSLKKSKEGTFEYSQAIGKLKDNFADILNISSGDKLSTKFVEKVAKDSARMTKILAGDAKAIQEFREEAFDDVIKGLDFDDKLKNIKSELVDLANVNPEFNWLDELNNKLDVTGLSANGLKDAISNIGEGATLSSEYTDALNAMLATGQITADDLNDIFSTIGYKPQVTTQYVDQQVEVPEYTTHHQIVSSRQVPMTRYVGSELLTDYVPEYTEKSWTVTSGTHVESQKVPVAQIESDENGAGKVNVVNAGSQRITPSHGSTSSGKGGGGSGGSRKAKEPKKASDEIERYHKIDKTIDSLSKQYDRLSAAKDKAFGTARLKLIEQENTLLQQQTENEKARLEEIKKYYAQDRSAIEAYGAIIDKNGVISNYDEIMQKELDTLNSAYEQYNAGGLSDEIIEAKEKEYEEFKKILKQFEDTNNEYLDQLQKIEEAIRAEITAELERIQAKVEIQLELPDQQLKMIEFKLSRLEDKAFSSGEKIALWGKQAEIAGNKFNILYSSLEEIFTLQDENGDWLGLNLTADQAQRLLAGDKAVLDEIKLTGENATEIMEALKTKQDELIEQYDAMAEAMKSIEEELTNQLDEYNEAIEKQISKIEKLGSIAQAMKDTINAVGKEVIGVPASVMRSINNNILKSSEVRANTYKAEYEAQTKALIAAREALGKAQTEEDKKYWQDMIDTTEEAMNDAKESMLAQIQDYAEQAATIFEETLTESLATMAKNMYGMTVDDAQAAFDRYTTLSEDFLQDYQKIYELSKMTRSIQASINDTDNIKAKQALRDLQEEINEYQAEGVQMTQYEVDYLNKKYELRLAEIALEEAQNAKDQVRLSRNADGGWGYVYTANQQNIDQAQQSYEDKLKELQDLNYQMLQETQSGILGLQKEFNDALMEIYGRRDLSKEEQEKQINSLRDFYIRRAKTLGTSLDTALANNKDTYDFWSSNRYGYGVSAPGNYIDTYGETFLGSLNPALTSGVNLANSFVTQMGDINTPGSIIGNSYQSWWDYTNEVSNMFSLIANNGETLEEAINREMTAVSEDIDNATDKVHELAQTMSEELPAAIENVSNIQSQWGPVLNEAAELIENLGTAIEGLIEKMNEYNDIDLKSFDIPDSSGLSSRYTAAIVAGSGNGDSGNGGIGGGFLGSGKNNDPSAINGSNGSYATLTKIAFLTPWDGGSFTYSTYSPTGMKKAVEEYYNTNRTKIGAWFIDQYKKGKMSGAYVNSYGGSDVIYGPSFEQFKKWILISNAGVSFDTGGYTGKFGPEGKLAMLHEKELVLNKQDTLNMLKMIALARDALGQVSIGSSLIAQTAASGYASGQTGFNSQNVSIEAHFPNVVDHNEIEQAFNNLANYAAQNAYNFDLSQRVNLF